LFLAFPASDPIPSHTSTRGGGLGVRCLQEVPQEALGDEDIILDGVDVPVPQMSGRRG